MREWNLKAGDPLSLTLAADARFGKTDYCNDQIWELTITGGEPPAVTLLTTYGLRARSMRLFPRFTEAEITRNDPSTFASPPSVCQFYPNLIKITFSPFTDIEVSIEYWIPTSQTAVGRTVITNRSESQRNIRVEWAALLMPGADGERMSPAIVDGICILSGCSSGLYPVVFLSGGPQHGSGPYPSLSLDVELPGQSSRSFNWSQAALASQEDSLELARSIIARNLEAEFARIEMINSRQLEIRTGDPDWDAAFALAQKVALGLFSGPTQALPHPSFVITRQPDNGFSIRRDGLDYNHLWNGQTPLDVYYLMGYVLLSDPSLAEGLLKNYLSSQSENGFIDWKPGLAGQRGEALATPILACLVWRIFEANDNFSFLEETFPHLIDFFKSWFTSQHDRDGDGIPEWDHPMQSGFDDHPLFSYWLDWSKGVDIKSAESPALCSFLYKECQALLSMAKLLDKKECISDLQAIAENLRTAVEVSWNPDLCNYQYWDRDAHYTSQEESLGACLGSEKIELNREFEHPVRLLIKVQTNDEGSRSPQIFIHGTCPNGQHLVEHLQREHFQWYMGKATATGERVYTHIEYVEILGFTHTDRIILCSAGYTGQDLTLLLPLWAGIPAEERVQDFIRHTILDENSYWKPFGIPACPYSINQPPNNTSQNIHMIWNSLIGEGLVAYGFRSEAATLVTRLMKSVIQNLKRDGVYRRYYHAERGQGLGERNALEGLAPLGLFLETLGVRLIGSNQVAVNGFNPFPWPVTVKYQGLRILCQAEKTVIIFLDGQVVTITDPSPHIVRLE